MDQNKQQPADNSPFANSERASDEDVARLAGGSPTRPVTQGGPSSAGGEPDREADPHPFANSEQATPEEVAARAAQSPSRLSEGGR